MVLGHPSSSAFSTPLITPSRISTQQITRTPATVCVEERGWRGTMSSTTGVSWVKRHLLKHNHCCPFRDRMCDLMHGKVDPLRADIPCDEVVHYSRWYPQTFPFQPLEQPFYRMSSSLLVISLFPLVLGVCNIFPPVGQPNFDLFP
jgi:hypothetical protein